MSDDELLELINKKDTDALDFLICKYKDLVNSKVNKYFIIGAEKEDIVQEGLIGLYKAIKDYKPDKQNSFKSFANLCIERQLITAIKSSNRQKHMPLNSYLSLNMTAFENEDGNNDTPIVDVLENTVIEDPLDTITKKEYFSSILFNFICIFLFFSYNLYSSGLYFPKFLSFYLIHWYQFFLLNISHNFL